MEMRKTTKITICITFLLVMILGMFCACNEKEPQKRGEFYTLREAYEQGMITKADLESISTCRLGVDGNPLSQYQKPLDKEIVYAIKETLAYEYNLGGYKLGVEEFGVMCYYGTYNGLPAIKRKGPYMYMAIVWDDIIDGVEFHYGSSQVIEIWKSI